MDEFLDKFRRIFILLKWVTYVSFLLPPTFLFGEITLQISVYVSCVILLLIHTWISQLKPFKNNF